jgi:hypothetical protein
MAPGMNRTRNPALVAGIIITGIVIALFLCGCIAPENETGNVTTSSLRNETPNITATPPAPEPPRVTLRVVKFEPARPCQSCTKLGNYAKETIEQYFLEDYQSGTISYQTVNYQDPQNIDLVKKYGVSGSSLHITVIVEGNEEETIDANDMWRYVGNKEEYMTVFKTKLEGILSEYEDA